MSKKQLETQGIVSELAGASVFFQRPASAPLPDSPEDRDRPSEALPLSGALSRRRKGAPVHRREGAKERSRAGAPAEQSRSKVKQGFQVYQDQVLALNELQFEVYRRTGKKPHIGEMVRSALDDFIARKKRELSRR